MVSIYDLTAGGLLPPGPSPGGGIMGDMTLGDLMRQQKQQQFFGNLSKIGAGLMQAGMGGPYGSQQQGLQAAMQGLSQAGQSDPMDLMRARYMQAQIAKMERPPERRIVEGGDGYKYYEDTGERVIPDAEKAPELTKVPLPGGGYMWAPKTEGTVGYEKPPDILNPDVEAARKRIAQAGKSDTTVNVLGERETERAKAFGKEIGEYYGEAFRGIQDAARASRAENTRMTAQEQLFEDVYTGTGARQLQGARKLAKLLGVEGLEEEIASGEAGQALADEAALQLRNPEGGAGMPGAMSDADRQFLQGMSGGMIMSREGRKLLFDVRRRVNERNIEIARDARAYMKENGQLDEGFFDQLDAKYASDPSKDLFAGLAMPETATSVSPGKTYVYDSDTDDLVMQ